MATCATKYWHTTPDGRSQCDLCPRVCKLREGQRGMCFVRKCEEGKIVLTTWGRSSGFCVDPVEKKPLNHFLPGTAVFSFGTAGCNLACKFCQNWDISKSREMDTLADGASPDTIAKAALSAGCRSVAFTYNDPVVFHEYAIDVARACRQQKLKVVAVSAGYVMPAPREEFYRYVDAANIDLKAFSNRFYKKVCAASLSPVLETLIYLKHETKVWLEITTLLIPGENESPEELEALATWIQKNLGEDVPLHFSAFHPDWKMQDKPATPPETLQLAREIALGCGLHYVYTGNIHDQTGNSTWCRNCGTQLIERDWYKLGAWNLRANGRCRSCGASCAGVFEDRPGNWGPRRMPVRLCETSH